MITLFGGWPTRSMRAQWLLEEMGVPYELRSVDLRHRRDDAEFMAINPSGFLPVLRDGETTMVESVAIMEYLIQRFGPTPLAPTKDDPAFAAYLQFLHLGEGGLAAYLNIVVASRFMAPDEEKDNWGARMTVEMFFNRLGHVVRRLEASPHLAGEAFSAADISVIYALEMGARLGLADRYDPVVTAYMERLSRREAYQRVLAKSPPQPFGLRPAQVSTG
jgi:glutathione S-transferase